MKSDLVKYSIYCLFDICLLWIFTQLLISAILTGSILMTLISSFIIATNIDSFIDRQRDFNKYFPNFKDKWLKF